MWIDWFAWRQSDLLRVGALLRFARLHVALLAGMYTVLGAAVASTGGIRHGSAVLQAAIFIGLIVTFGFITNDYHDADLDRFSKPYRPIPSGRVSRGFALLLACMSAGLALLVAASIDMRSAAAALVLVICSATYSYFLKATLLLGIATVALLNVSTVLCGCLAADMFSPAALLLAVFAFLNAGAQETLYNLVDRAEDARYGVRTTAVRLGPEKTVRLFATLTLACAAATLAPWVIHVGSAVYIWAALPCSTLPLLGIVLVVWRDPTQETYGRAHRIMKLVRLSSIVPVLLLR